MNEENEPVTGECAAQPSANDQSAAGSDPVLGDLCLMGGQLTRGEIAHNGVFRAGDTCEPGSVKYPTSAVAAEPKGR